MFFITLILLSFEPFLIRIDWLIVEKFLRIETVSGDRNITNNQSIGSLQGIALFVKGDSQ